MNRVQKRACALDEAKRIVENGDGTRGVDIVQLRVLFEHLPRQRVELVVDANKTRLATPSQNTDFVAAGLRHRGTPPKISWG